MRYLIVGNSAAAVGAIEAIRQRDRRGSIMVLSGEPYPSYCRPLISYYLAGKVSEKALVYRKPEFYRKNRVEVMTGKTVARLHPEERVVRMECGQDFSYEKLLIASGGVPLVPPMERGNAEGVFRFTTLNDAKGIRRYVGRMHVRRAVVLGGGLIGLKATEALQGLSLEVVVVELADRILSVTFDQTASQIMADQLRSTGVNLITGNTVAEVQVRGGRVRGVVLRDGSSLECQLVIVAIGVKPNTSLIGGSGIATNRGILVNRYMETNLPDVYAAGDVAEAYDLLLGSNRIMAIWPNAYRQGAIAGYNMAGDQREYGGGFFMNSVEIGGLPSISVGITDPPGHECETMEQWDGRRMAYKKLVFRENRLVGAIVIGDIDRAGIYTGLIQHKLDVGEFRKNLLRSDFGLISLPKAYRKHLISGEEVES